MAEYTYESLLHGIGAKDYGFIDLCIANGVKISKRNDKTLDFAYDDLEMVKKLFSLGLKIRSKNWRGLLLACEEGNYDVVEYILGKVDEKYIPDDILGRACAGGNKAVVKLLIDNGISVIYEDSAVYQATYSNNKETLLYVIEQYTQKKELQGLNGLLASCIELGFVDMVEVLMSVGLKIDFPPRELAGLVYRSNDIEMYRYLHNKGFELDKASVEIFSKLRPSFGECVLAVEQEKILKTDIKSIISATPRKLKV